MPPRLSDLNLWKRHQERVCEVLEYALILLSQKPNLIQDEDSLNRELHGCLREANAYLYKMGKGLDTQFYLESRNQPSADHSEKHGRENKRPDLQNGLVDHNEFDPRKQNKNFAIECKRLGMPLSSNWRLNENYVNHGISRFVSEEHEYGRDVDSGAMVGYVESSDFDHILGEVNTTLNVVHSAQAPLELQNDWDSSDAKILEHSLQRVFPVSPFALKHFWIDLRGKLVPLTAKSSNELETDSESIPAKRVKPKRRKHSMDRHNDG